MTNPKPKTRQRAYQLRKQSSGLCVICGRKRGKTGTTAHCRRCADKKNEMQRVRRSNQAGDQ